MDWLKIAVAVDQGTAGEMKPVTEGHLQNKKAQNCAEDVRSW